MVSDVKRAKIIFIQQIQKVFLILAVEYNNTDIKPQIIMRKLFKLEIFNVQMTVLRKSVYLQEKNNKKTPSPKARPGQIVSSWPKQEQYQLKRRLQPKINYAQEKIREIF